MSTPETEYVAALLVRGGHPDVFGATLGLTGDLDPTKRDDLDMRLVVATLSGIVAVLLAEDDERLQEILAMLEEADA